MGLTCLTVSKCGLRPAISSPEPPPWKVLVTKAPPGFSCSRAKAAAAPLATPRRLGYIAPAKRRLLMEIREGLTFDDVLLEPGPS